MHLTHEIIKNEKIAYYILERGLGVVGLLFLTITKIDGEMCTASFLNLFYDVY